MTGERGRGLVLCGMLASLGAGGCVPPSEFDTNLLTRYQESVLARSPQRRKDRGLDLLRPVSAREVVPLKISPDPADKVPVVELSLDQAVRLALLNSLDIRVVSFDSAMARETVISAEAEFDEVVFGSLSHAKAEERPGSGLMSSKSRDMPMEVGIRKRTTLGSELELKYSLTRSTDDSAFTMPNPRWDSRLELQLTQPLLRFGGKEFNLATLEVARLDHKSSLASFREQVEAVVTAVETAYWSLLQGKRELAIQQRLLRKTEETEQRVKGRGEIDATKVERKQAEAAVKSRKAALLSVERAIADIQDQLVRLLADPRLGILNTYRIKPVDSLVTAEVALDLKDQLALALKNVASLERARLAMQQADIRVKVAENAALPLLNLTASAGVQGMKGNPGPAVGDMFSLKFLSHSLGLLFEYPLGNRAARAELRRQKFGRLQAIVDYQNVADQVAVSVASAVRQVKTAHAEIQAQRAAKLAFEAQLAALDAVEFRRALSPEFLQVKLNAQELLASVERAELKATIDYNNALADLSRVTGTALQRKRVKLAAESAIQGRPLPRAPKPD